MHPPTGGAVAYLHRAYRGHHQSQWSAQRKFSVHPPANSGCDRRILRLTAGEGRIGCRAATGRQVLPGAGDSSVTACEPPVCPVCVSSCPSQWLRTDLARFGGFTRDEKRNRINVGVTDGASSQSHLPAVRAVTGIFRMTEVGSKQPAGITFAVTIPEHLLSQQKTGSTPWKRAAFEQKREVFPVPDAGEKSNSGTPVSGGRGPQPHRLHRECRRFLS